MNQAMIKNLITLLIVGLVLFLIYYVFGLFVVGVVKYIIGVILALVFLFFVLKTFEIA
jgi:hypothetical protein